LGLAVLGKEKFRWHFGPMFYRGRLGDNQVKVLVIGQEGAQDESLAQRSFTGGTGARMQHFLHHIGITRSTCS
jgi:uracil-DNA glycosylase